MITTPNNIAKEDLSLLHKEEDTVMYNWSEDKWDYRHGIDVAYPYYDKPLNMNKYKYCVFLDAGHGGIDPETKTYTTAPGKMFHHEGQILHKGGDFYEGVKNRLYCDMIANMLTKLNVNVVKVYHEYKDTPLEVRTRIANDYHNNIQPGIYLSEHSNAVSNPLHNAKGLSIYTSKGTSKSDELSAMFGKQFKKDLSDVIRYRLGPDGEYDHEENFWVLRKTDMPSILFENLFFDNLEEANKLHTKEYAEKYCSSFVEATIQCLEHMENPKNDLVQDVD